MSFYGKSFYLVPMLALAILATACSSSPPASEANTEGALPLPESSADEVGSVPEDMLIDDQGTEALAEAAPAPEATPDALESTPAEDPFGDLKEKDQAAADRDALLVPEEENSEKAEASGSGQMDRYTVKPGDTLMKVAFHLYGDVERWKELQELNREALKGGEHLRKGMKLRYEVPSEPFVLDEHAKVYEIKKGDTLAGIADEVYGRKMKYKKLQGYNKKLIKNPNRIFAGFTIYYDITEQEMAEAEARRAERAAAAGSAPANVPSAISPPPEAAAPPPSNVATDNSAVQGPTAAPAQ